MKRSRRTSKGIMAPRRVSAICIVLLVAATTAFGDIAKGESMQRGRNEGTIDIPASNVIGTSNITAWTDIITGYSANGFRLEPAVGGVIGAGGIIQLEGRVVPFGGHGLGPMEAHLQMTLPGNDMLRFVGMAPRADLYLSTEIDTITPTANPDKPNYSPSLVGSLIIDLDWLALFRRFPLKTYFMAGMADNTQLLYRYNQLSGSVGLEWKMYRHSLFVDAGGALYKEKANTLIDNIADKTYAQSYAWIAPGGRYRLLNRFSILGGARFVLYQDRKKNNPITPDVLRLDLRFEAPLYFRETNTEAIRTLVFMEQEKEKKRVADTLAQAEARKDYFGEYNLGLGVNQVQGETFDYAKERQDLIKKRQEIQTKMDEIENILNETNADDSLIAQPEKP
jgi:hypothetical protein